MGRHLKSAHGLFNEDSQISNLQTLTKLLKPNKLTLEDKVNRKLALAIGTSSAPNSLIKNKFFVSAIKQLSPGFKLYNRKQVSSLILEESNKIINLIQERIEKTKNNGSNMKAALKKTKEKLFEGGEIDLDKSSYSELKGSFNFVKTE
ncbi:MAG: hypothetical protein MHPSP_003964, partial [Paramarteilia canceri]